MPSCWRVTMQNWVANFVKNYENTVVLVSHDEELLRTGVDSIAEVGNLAVLAVVSVSSKLQYRPDKVCSRYL